MKNDLIITKQKEILKRNIPSISASFSKYKIPLFALILLLSFSGYAQFTTVGSAQSLGDGPCNGDCYELTPDQTWTSGAIWSDTKLDIQKPFEICFNANFGNKDANGADGIAFVMQNALPGMFPLGGWGGFMGYGPTHPLGPGGIDPGTAITPSIAIEFDTYDNGTGGIYGGKDIIADHISIVKNANVLSPEVTVQADPNDINIEDGECHTICINWDPATETIQVSFDGNVRINQIIDIKTGVFGGLNQINWGFTAATGANSNRQVICLESCCNSVTSDINQRNDWQWVGGNHVELCCYEVSVYRNYPFECDVYAIEYETSDGYTFTESIGANPIIGTPNQDHYPDREFCRPVSWGPLDITVRFLDENGAVLCEDEHVLDCSSSGKRNTRPSSEATQDLDLSFSPNPSSGLVEVNFTTQGDGIVLLEAISLDGKRVILVNEVYKTGMHTFMFDGKELSNGIHLIRLTNGKQQASGKLLIKH